MAISILVQNLVDTNRDCQAMCIVWFRKVPIRHILGKPSHSLGPQSPSSEIDDHQWRFVIVVYGEIGKSELCLKFVNIGNGETPNVRYTQHSSHLKLLKQLLGVFWIVRQDRLSLILGNCVGHTWGSLRK